MSYLVLISNDVATCSTDNLLISQDDVLKLSSAENVLDYIRTLKEKEESKIKAAVLDGYEVGYQEGIEKAETKINELFKTYLNDLTENIYTNRIETDHEIIELACDVTKKIATGIAPNEMIEKLAITAIQNLSNKRELQIKVNPDHVAALQEKLNSIAHDSNSELSTMEVKADQMLGSLDVIIKSPTGDTIASFDDQLKMLKNNMLDELSL
ncbi:MAG: FliH/SctL family protein [Candidatus Thiodiazotropha sp.]